MFIEYRFDVKECLRKGENSIRVEINSPIKIPKALERNYGKLHAGEETARVYIRKAQYSYGWDWGGARIATSGIYRNIYIDCFKDARIYGSYAYIEDLNGEITFTGYVDLKDKEIDKYDVDILLNGNLVITLPVKKLFRKVWIWRQKEVKNLKLWYPHDLGESYLYDIEFKLKKAGEEIYSEKKKIGFRTVQLLRENDGEGESFIFEVNGKKNYLLKEQTGFLLITF